MPNIRDSNCQSITAETERNGYNLAFCELDLEWYWDAHTYAGLQAISEKKSHVQAYLEAHRPHLLRAYDADFLANAVETVRSRFGQTMAY